MCNNLKSIPFILLYCFLQFQTIAQENGFGIKGGPSLGYQKWGTNQRDPLLRWHLAAFMDSEGSDGKSVVYGQFGYHVKGGAFIVPYFYDINRNAYPGGTYGMEFRNLSLDLGLKKYLSIGTWKPYYAIGLRGEYTVSTKFELYQNLDNNDYIHRWNYGFSLKIGTEYTFSKMVHGGLELNVAPDLSKQIYVDPSIPRYNPYTRLYERGSEISAINTTIELSFYLRFIQIIQYDE